MTQPLGLPSSARNPASRRRQDRLTVARMKGYHSKTEWQVLRNIFDHCVCCSNAVANLYGGAATKDHIEPIMFGGCDCIANIQPVCRNCNSAGIFHDFRERAVPGWQTIYLHRMGAYY